MLLLISNSNTYAFDNKKFCAVPDLVAVSNITLTNATVVWQSVNNAVLYEIKYKQVNTQTWFGAQALGAGKTITGLIPYTDYEVQVQSICDLSQSVVSGYSASVFFTTLADTVLLRGPYLQAVTPNSIVVRWRTNTPVDSKVFFGTQFPLQSFVYSALQTTEHVVKLTGLNSNTQYFYSVGTSAETIQGDSVNFFITAPVKNKIAPYRFWVTGDQGKSSVAQVAVRDAFMNYTGNTHPALWLWLGDNAYENGTDAEFQSNIFDKYPQQFKNIPLHPSPGNHDYANAGYLGADTREFNFPYFSIFTLPDNGEAGGFPSKNKKYYSYDYGNIHFVSLDSYGAYNDASSAMYKWLDADLKANELRWTIIYFHHPPYTMISHNSNNEIECIDMRSNLVPLFDKHNVDLVLSGHAHGNERSYLIRGHTGRSETFNESMILNKHANNILKRPPYKGTVYAVCGSSAQNIGTAQSEFPLQCMAFNDTIHNCSMVIDVHADSLKAIYLSSTGSISDSFTIVKTSVPILTNDANLYCHKSGNAIEVNFIKYPEKNYSIKLVSSQGQTVYQFNGVAQFEKDNYASYELKLSQQTISEGVYYVVVDDGISRQTCKVVFAD